MKKKLVLKRDVLTEIDGPALGAVVGGDRPTRFTCFSCMTYVSCNPLDCIGGPSFVCLEG